MVKIFCIQTKISDPNAIVPNGCPVNEPGVYSGKWYIGEEYMILSEEYMIHQSINPRYGRMYRIFGEGRSTPSELVMPKPTGLKVDGLVIYEGYIGLFSQELFITKAEWRERLIDEII